MSLSSKLLFSKWFNALVVVLLVSLIIRIAAPHAIQYYVNYQLKHTQGITGHVGDVDFFYTKGPMPLMI
jgi:hypothetical protein